MKHKITITFAFLTILTSCKTIQTQESTSNEKIVEVTDSLNRKVKVTQKEDLKVACIGAGALRLYSYIGDIKNLCGIEDIDRSVNADPFKDITRPYYDLHKDEFAKLPSVGKGGPKNQAAEAEKIMECKPDLIFSQYLDTKLADNLQDKIGKPVVTIAYGMNSVFDDAILNSLDILGKALNKEEKASTLKKYINDSKKELEYKASASTASKSTFYIGGLGNWGTQDIYSTSTSFPLFKVSNITNAVQGVEISQGNIDKEAFFKLKMDKIILDAAGVSKFKESYQKDKASFDSLDAIKNGEVYLEMPFNAYYTNLEVALMDAYYIASIAYPDQYADFNIEEKSDEISKAFLGQECYSIIKDKPLSYGGFQKITSLGDFLNK